MAGRGPNRAAGGAVPDDDASPHAGRAGDRARWEHAGLVHRRVADPIRKADRQGEELEFARAAPVRLNAALDPILSE